MKAALLPSSPREPLNPVAPVPVLATPHLVFVVASESYACPIEFIEHVLRKADVSLQARSADAPAWEAGRLVTPNRNVPVISLGALWGLPAHPGKAERESILLVKLPGKSFALLVDECRTVISRLPDNTAGFRVPYELRGSRGSALESVVLWQNSLLVILRLEKLVSSEFDNLLAPK